MNHHKPFRRILALSIVVALGMTPVTAIGETPPIGASGEVISFEALPEQTAKQTMTLGDALGDLDLPDTLTATVRMTTASGAAKQEESVEDSGEAEWAEMTIPVQEEWDSAPDYDGNTADTYVFIAEIQGFTLAEGVTAPAITVTVESDTSKPPQGGEITAFAPLDADIAEQPVPIGMERSALELPETLMVTVGGEEAQIPAAWTSVTDYDAETAGEYVFTPVLPEGYTLAGGVTLPSITVMVEEPMLRSLADGASSHVGDVALFPYDFAPQSWKAANGDSLAKAGNEALFILLETRFGGDGVTSFNLPDLRNHAPHSSLRYHIAVGEAAGREPVISEVRLFPYDAEAAMPAVWRRCDGRLLGIDASDANETLFQFIGTLYGGDGENTFALPDLRALEPEGMGYYICLPDDPNVLIEDALIGEMILIAGAPNPTMLESIVPCDGSQLTILTNQALFSLLATTFGGDGRDNFAIPNTCGAAGSPSDLMNPLPGLQYYIVTSPSATFPNP